MPTTRATAHRPLVPPISAEEPRERNARLAATLERLKAEGDTAEQRETFAVLEQALGPDRTMSERSAFRP